MVYNQIEMVTDMKLFLIILAGLFTVVILLVASILWKSQSKIQELERALKAPPQDVLLTLTNHTILNIGNAIVFRVSDDEWSVLTNAYPTNVRTKTLTFYKDSK